MTLTREALDSVESPRPDAAPAPDGDTVDHCLSIDRPHPRPDGEDRYTISEVSAHTGLSVHTLRWYERIGLMQHIDRSHTGQRRYTNKDLEWLALIGKLRLTGMAVADMVRYAELVRQGDHTFPERRALLSATRDAVRHRIAELEGTLAVLDFKIDLYSSDAPWSGAESSGASARA